MTRLGLIADDLTGALDSAAQFTGRFGSIPVLLRPDATLPPRSFALDLNCRDGSESEAVRRARETAGRLGAAEIAFKKIDSLLRGHWAAELAAIMALGLFDRAVLAPAFPAQGRVTRDGRQHARAPNGGWRIVPIDPAHELARRGLMARRIDATPTGTDTGPVLLGDAESDEDLARLVDAVRQQSGRTLWCGSAGLARALAAVPPAAIDPPPASHLILIGTNHAVTQGQISRMNRARPESMVWFDDNAAASATTIGRVLAQHRCCVAMPALEQSLPRLEAADRIGRWLAAMLPCLPAPEALTVVGGETFAAACRALRAGTLTVDGEWRPGVPASCMADGAWAATRCFSKSGAFGSDDLLLNLLGR